MSHIDHIIENYRNMEKELITKLNYSIGHHGVTGGNREDIWVEFFRRIVPKKFNIARGVFIIDSKTNCSKEVDIAIYDEQYTPYIFNYGLITFIPIEAVAAVVQCKSKSLKNKNLKEWVQAIENLKTSQDSFVRLATNVHIGKKAGNVIQTETTPIKILCYISEKESTTDYSSGRECFDIAIESFYEKKETTPKEDNKSLKKGEDKEKENGKSSKGSNGEQKNDDIKRDWNTGNLKITFFGNCKKENDQNPNLYEILCKYNRGGDKIELEREAFEELKGTGIDQFEVARKDKDGNNIEEYTLLSFIFQFNQMLMLINNPMFFPHKAYVEMFNKIGGE